jgi:hypothetical protein
MFDVIWCLSQFLLALLVRVLIRVVLFVTGPAASDVPRSAGGGDEDEKKPDVAATDAAEVKDETRIDVEPSDQPVAAEHPSLQTRLLNVFGFGRKRHEHGADGEDGEALHHHDGADEGDHETGYVPYSVSRLSECATRWPCCISVCYPFTPC